MRVRESETVKEREREREREREMNGAIRRRNGAEDIQEPTAAASASEVVVESAVQAAWLAENPSKRWSEMFYLCYSPFWMTYALAFVVPLQLYEDFGKLEYMLLCSLCAAPCVLLPAFVLRPCAADASVPIFERHWVRANVWVAIFSYIGNYFWTHYFYRVLGAYYTFEAWTLNRVPICLYLMTHAYFMFYFSLSNVVLRNVVRLTAMPRMRASVRTTRSSSSSSSSKKEHGASALMWTARTYVAFAVTVFVMSYVTAFMETLTIANFKYYTFVDKEKMYSVGSLFYAIYFFVGFPMFYRMDEASGCVGGSSTASAKKGIKKKNDDDDDDDDDRDATPWTLSRVAIDSLAAGMLVTILLDLWRLALGPIVKVPEFLMRGDSVPWLR